ncbi:MAG: hypothetical protein WAT36_03925, partial [Chromatiaceae bacterium]
MLASQSTTRPGQDPRIRSIARSPGAACLATALALATPAAATEGGGGHYPNGAEDFMVGALPPPGTYFIN